MIKKVNAILPMRAGSQRIKDKNILEIEGRPLYEYILNKLLSCELIDKVIINTDIKQIIDKYKDNPQVIIIEREDHLRGNCNINHVIEDTLNKIEGEHFIQIHATNPLLRRETIEMGIQRYFEVLDSNDSVFSVTRTKKRFWDSNVQPMNHDPKAAPTTQDLEHWFEENSCFYIFSREIFFKNNHRIGDRSLIFETPHLESIDIDEEHELELVKRLIDMFDN